MAQLYANYKRRQKGGRGKKRSFKDYLMDIGLLKHREPLPGRDTGRHMVARGVHLVSVPKRVVSGPVRVMVLLVDFPDKPAYRPKREFEDMLFSQASYLTGSMRDYYKQVSNGKVNVTGSVHGWYRMPKPYSYYVGNDSGCGIYPTNAQTLTEHALKAAQKKRVPFPAGLDKFGNGSITALVIVHAGTGAEGFTDRQQQLKHIWSHKGDMNGPMLVKSGLAATNYLTVPEDCRMGVCAHELGHLAFQWDDFYDPNYDKDGSEWDGAGNWDLMAGGSWNNGGNTPAHPAGLHKLQHNWVKLLDVDSTTRGIKLPPYYAGSPAVLRVRSAAFSATQCLVIENRARNGFDAQLPGSGVLVWRVDTDQEQMSAEKPAMLLIQADGKHDLEKVEPLGQPGNVGDVGDPFPGPLGRNTSLGDTGKISTSFPGKRSRIQLKNIKVDRTTRVATLDIIIK